MNQLNQANSNNSFEDETMDLKELFDLLWKGRNLIILTTAVFAIGSFIYAQSLSDSYK